MGRAAGPGGLFLQRRRLEKSKLMTNETVIDKSTIYSSIIFVSR